MEKQRKELGEMFELPTKIEKDASGSLRQLGLEWDDLQNKKVLDVGAGIGNLTWAAKQKGINIVSLELLPELRQQQENRKIPNDVKENYVKADALMMPFADESFDLIISVGGPPAGFEKEEDIVRILEEFLRILKQNGEARFFNHLGIAFKKTGGMKKLKGEEMIKFVKKESVKFFKKLQKNGFDITINKEGDAPLWQSVSVTLRKK